MHTHTHKRIAGADTGKWYMEGVGFKSGRKVNLGSGQSIAVVTRIKKKECQLGLDQTSDAFPTLAYEVIVNTFSRDAHY